MKLEGRWVHVNNRRMFVRLGGRPGALPIVLVHGVAVSSRYMIPLARELAVDFAVYAPDLPGFGRTPATRETLGPVELGRWLLAWMKAMGLERAVMIGNSMGCQTIAELAQIAPERVRGSVLLGPTADQSAGFTSHIIRLLLDQFVEPLPLIPLQAFEFFSYGPFRTARTFARALRIDLCERVAALHSPTVVIRGEKDPIAPERWCRQVAAVLSRGQFFTIPGAGHALNYNSPQQVAAVVREFVRGLEC